MTKRSVSDLADLLTGLLQDHGFARSREAVPRGHTWWIRFGEWKEDCIWMVHHRGGDSMTLSMCVHVILSDGSRIAIDGGSVSYESRKKTEYRMGLEGSLLRNWRLARLRRTVTSDIAVALDWFRGYESPEACLTIMNSPERNGCAVGTEAWNRVRSRLFELVNPVE